MRRALCVLVVSVTLMGTAQAAHAEERQARATQVATDVEVSSAMAAAVNGDNSSLERLLTSPKAPAMRSAILEWVRANPQPPDLERAMALRARQSTLTLTGQYDYYCTGYNGFTIGWNGKTFRACHGYLNSYISGLHAGHYLPDVYPSGNPVTVACAKSAGGAGLTLLGLAAGGPTNALGWAVLGAAASWNVLDLWQNCKRR